MAPALVAPCQAVDGLAVGTYAISGLMLEVAPAYRPDHEAVDVLVPFCSEIGTGLDRGLAAHAAGVSALR